MAREAVVLAVIQARSFGSADRALAQVETHGRRALICDREIVHPPANAGAACSRLRAAEDGRRRSVVAHNRRVFGEERADRIVGGPRQLHLRHVPAVELEVAGLRESLGNVPGERDRHERVAAPPDEQGV